MKKIEIVKVKLVKEKDLFVNNKCIWKSNTKK